MARMDPSVAHARCAVRTVLSGLPEDALVLVACSGGADSLALAYALSREAPRVGRSVRSRAYGVRAGAVVVDHGMQPGSDDVAARAAARCRDLGLDPVTVSSVTVDDDGPGGPEATARHARYAALDQAAEETGAALILLGHTLDDQAEQVLLGLARGAGARSLAGMPSARGRYRRPFLGLRRADTEAVCGAAGLTFWTDPTNLVPESSHPSELPKRSQVRGIVLPVLEEVLGPGVAAALARSAAHLRDDADALDTLAADLLDRARIPGGDVLLDVAILESAPPAVRRRALRLAAHLVTDTPTTARHVAALDALVVSWNGQGAAHLPGGARGERSYGSLFLRPGAADLRPRDDAQRTSPIQE